MIKTTAYSLQTLGIRCPDKFQAESTFFPLYKIFISTITITWTQHRFKKNCSRIIFMSNKTNRLDTRVLVKLDRLGKTYWPANWFIFEKDTTEEDGALDPHCGG